MIIFQQWTQKRKFIILVMVFVSVVASIVYIIMSNDQDISLSSPKFACPVKLNWKGIVPGVSTRQDVLSLLGNPDEEGRLKFKDSKTIPYFGYRVAGGVIAEFVQHRIFFRADGKVDWIVVIVADSDGKFHSAQEVAEQLGYTVDIVYTNNDFNPYADFQYDVLGGPDDILIWSECGVAISVLWDGHWNLAENPESGRQLIMRYPNLSSMDSSADDLTFRSLHGTVMMKFLFQPTDYESFKKYYMYRIPYGLWDDYRVKMDR
jgi:hypothetical protein